MQLAVSPGRPAEGRMPLSTAECMCLLNCRWHSKRLLPCWHFFFCYTFEGEKDEDCAG